MRNLKRIWTIVLIVLIVISILVFTPLVEIILLHTQIMTKTIH